MRPQRTPKGMKVPDRTNVRLCPVSDRQPKGPSRPAAACPARQKRTFADFPAWPLKQVLAKIRELSARNAPGLEAAVVDVQASIARGALEARELSRVDRELLSGWSMSLP